MSDGGFAAVMYEEVYTGGNPSPLADEGFLLLFNKDGELLWKTSLKQVAIPYLYMQDAIICNGFLVVAEEPLPGGEPVWIYDLFDLNTGLLIDRIQQPMSMEITNYTADFIMLDSGLWIKRILRTNNKEDKYDVMLMKVPVSID